MSRDTDESFERILGTGGAGIARLPYAEKMAEGEGRSISAYAYGGVGHSFLLCIIVIVQCNGAKRIYI